MKHCLKTSWILICLLWLYTLSAQDTNPYINLNWAELPAIPSAPGAAAQPGLAGAFIGVHNDALLIAGGANFPDGLAWEGAIKVYHNDIYILEKYKDQYSWYSKRRFTLPKKIAYGVSIATHKGLICIGGTNGSTESEDVYQMSWNNQLKEIKIESLSPLPFPMSNMSGGLIGNKIYLSGINKTNQQKFFGLLDLEAIRNGWQELALWGGAPRTHAIGIVQNNGKEDCFYLFKGRYKGQDSLSALHSDSWIYNPSSKQWSEINDAAAKGPEFLSAGTAIATGANSILFFGGDDGLIFNQLEGFISKIVSAKDSAELNQLVKERNTILENHPGFSQDIWSFQTITQSWTKVGVLPNKTQVTTTAAKWNDLTIIPTGEIQPSIRTPAIRTLSISNNTSFGTINYIVLVSYLLVLVIIGFIFSKNQVSTDDFFKGGNRIPWWAAGISIFGTQLSAITFMAIPAKTFATDWLYFFLMMTIIMVSPFIIKYFLPFYRRFNLTTAYEYLELRFNLATRLIGSGMYIFLQLGRLGIVLLLPSLALSVVTGIDVNACIIVMGILSILYTVLGGIEAVIWTDVLQVVILLGGAIISLCMLLLNLDSNDISLYTSEFQKLRVFDFELSFSDPTLWVVLIGGLASNVIQYGSDQTVVQRYLTTKDEKSAAKSIRTGAWMALPSTLIFFSLGTLLFIHYKVQPDLLSPVLDKTDTIFPWYIIHSLPEGLSGLLIAAVFAASMSSLDSSMNSVATVVTTDYFKRLQALRSDSEYLKIARWVTVIIGMLGTVLAVTMATWGISSLWDQFNLIVGLFAGGLGGIFILGIFSTKANGHSALIGLISSGIIQYLISEYTDVHFLMYAMTGMLASIIIGYLASLVIGNVTNEKIQYTYYKL